MSIHVEYGYPKGSKVFRQCDEALPSHLASIPSFMNKRVDGYIFSHLEKKYLGDM